MDTMRKEVLDLLNKKASVNPGAFSHSQQQTLGEYNNLYEKDPGYFESQGFARDLLRTVGQIPTGFAEGFTTLDMDFIEPRTESEKIARSIGSLLGFVGYIPSPSALALQVAGKAHKGTAIKMLSKELAPSLTKELAGMPLEKITEQYIKGRSTNALTAVFPHAKSIPMLLTDKAMKTKFMEKSGKAAYDLLAKSKYLKENKWVNLDRIADVGEGMMNLGLASAISAGGINPFQWKERVDSVLPAFTHGAAFGGVFRGLGNLGSALNMLNKQGDPSAAAKLLQATAGSIFQGLPATMRDASTEEQVYEYLLGAWFGFHERPHKTRVAEKKIAEINGKMIGRGGKQGDESISVNFRTDMKEFHKQMEIGKLPKDSQRILMAKLKKQFDLNPGHPKALLEELGLEYTPDYMYDVTGKDANGVEFSVPVHRRDPHKMKPILNGAMYKDGIVYIDIQHLEPMVKRWKTEGFKGQGKLKDIDSSTFKTEAEIREFIINHEIFHKHYTSEKLATAIAVAETLAKDGAEGLKRIPEDFPLVESLSKTERAEYNRFIERIKAEPYNLSKIPTGSYISYNIKDGTNVRGGRGWIMEYNQDKRAYFVKMEQRNGVGDYEMTDRIVEIPENTIHHVLEGKQIEVEPLGSHGGNLPPEVMAGVEQVLSGGEVRMKNELPDNILPPEMREAHEGVELNIQGQSEPAPEATLVKPEGKQSTPVANELKKPVKPKSEVVIDEVKRDSKPKDEVSETITDYEIVGDLEDHRNVSRIKDSLWLEMGDYAEVNTKMEAFQEDYSHMTRKEFEKHVEAEFPGKGKEAVVHFSNQTKVRKVSLMADGLGLTHDYQRNTMTDRVFGERILQSEPEMETKLLERINNNPDLKEKLGNTGEYTLQELVERAGMTEALLKKGIDLGHYVDLKHPVGKYSRVLFKMNDKHLAELATMDRASEAYKVARDKAEQASFEEYLGEMFTPEYLANTPIEKVIKYLGQWNTDATFSPNKESYEVTIVNDEGFLRKLSKDSAYKAFVEEANAKGEQFDIKSFVDGAMFISSKMRGRMINTFSLGEDAANMKPVIVHRDKATGESFVGKGEMYPNSVIEMFMQNNGIDVLMFDSSAKVRSLGKVGKMPADEVSIDYMSTGGKTSARKFPMPESSIGFIKADKTAGKGKTTISNQIIDTLSDPASVHGFLEMYVQPEVDKYEALGDAVKSSDKFNRILIEKGLGAKINDETGEISFHGTDKAMEYIKLLQDGMNPFSPPLADSTRNYLKQIIQRIAKPTTRAGEWGTIGTDIGMRHVKKKGKWVIDKTPLKERRIVNGKMLPGEAVLPALYQNKMMNPENLWVFDNVSHEYVPVTHALPQLIGHAGPVRFGEVNYQVTRLRDLQTKEQRYNMVLMFGSSPKQKPEDTLIVSVKDIRKKSMEMENGEEFKFGSEIELNTPDASIAAERDWDGDAGASVLEIPSSLIKEYTQGVLHNSNFRVGSTNTPKANNKGLSPTNLKDYHRLNDKVYLAGRRVGETVNRSAEYSAIITSGLGIEYNGRKLKPIKKDVMEDLQNLALFAQEKQTVIDAIKSDLNALKDLMAKDYTKRARRRAYGTEEDAVQDIMLSVITEPIANAIKSTNPRRFGQNTRNKELFDVYQSQNDLLVLERAEQGKLEGLDINDVYGLIWARKAAKHINTYNRVLQENQQIGNYNAKGAALKAIGKTGRAYLEMYENAKHEGKEIDWRTLNGRVADMMIDPTTGEQFFVKEGKVTRTDYADGTHSNDVKLEYTPMIRIPRFHVSGKHATSSRQELLKKIKTRYVDNYNLVNYDKAKWFGGEKGGQHTLDRESGIRDRLSSSVHNDALQRIYEQEYPGLKEMLDAGKSRQSGNYHELATTMMLRNVIKTHGQDAAYEMATLMFHRYIRQKMVYKNGDALDPASRERAYTKSIKGLMDFIDLHGFGQWQTNKRGVGIEKMAGYDIKKNSKRHPDTEKLVLDHLRKVTDSFRDKSGEWLTDKLDTAIMETWDKYPDLRTVMLYDPVSDVGGKNNKNYSQHHNFLRPSSLLWNEALQDKAFRNQYTKEFNNAQDDVAAGKPLHYNEAYISGVGELVKNANKDGEHFFPYGNFEKAIDATNYKQGKYVKDMSQAQKTALQTLFQDLPGFGNNFTGVLVDMIGKPRIDNHKELNYVINELSQINVGKPNLGAFQRQAMPKWVSRYMMKYDAQFASKQQGFGSFARPSSAMGRVMRLHLDAKALEQEETQKLQSVINSVAWLHEMPSYVAKEYKLEDNGTMFTERETPFVEQWKTMIQEDAGGMRDLFRIAVYMHQIKNAPDGWKDPAIGERLWGKRHKLYEEAKVEYDGLKENGGRAKQEYVNYMMRHLNKFSNHMQSNYIDMRHGSKYSMIRSKQDAKIYMLPKEIKKLEAKLDGLYRAKDQNEGAIKSTQKSIDIKTAQLKKLKGLEQIGLVDNKLVAPMIAGHFHHMWETPEALEASLRVERDAAHAELAEQKGKYSEKEFLARTDGINNRFKKIEKQMLDELGEPIGKEMFENRITEDWNPLRTSAVDQMREMELGGYSTDIPLVLMKYAKDVLHQTITLDAIIKSRKEIEAFGKRMEDKWGSDPEALSQVGRIKDFMQSYVRDSAGYIPEGNVRPKMFKYLFDKAKGIDVSKNPGDYETPWSDMSVMNTINNRRKKQGKELLPVWQAAAWANMEAKYEYLTLLTHPKYSLGNLVGGTANTLVYGGLKRYIEAGKRLSDRVFRQEIEAKGIYPEMMAYEFDLESTIGKKAEWGGFGEKAKEIILGEGTLMEKRKLLVNAGRDYNVGQKVMQVASMFGAPIEQKLRQRAFTVGYLMAEENHLTGEAQAEFARDFVTATQYLYHNAVRPEFARTSLGKIMTRFMMYFWSTMDFQKQMKLDAQKMNVMPDSEEYKRMQRWGAFSMVMMGMASIYPYSLFDSALPPHLDILKDASEALFGDEKDRDGAFFGSYGLNVVTSPLPSRVLLRPMLTIMNGDYQRYLNSEIYSFFPFGRFAKSTARTLQNPYYAPETFGGIPLLGIARDPKKIAASKENNEWGYMYPGRRSG